METSNEIHIANSLFEMDGGSRKIDGRQVFVLGLDSIAKYHNALTDTPFFHHELFHLYHAQVRKI